MKYNVFKRLSVQIIALALFFSFTLFACGGVHNDPPAEIVRVNGAGPSSRAAAETPSTIDQVEETLQTVVLDSSGNPINTEE